MNRTVAIDDLKSELKEKVDKAPKEYYPLDLLIKEGFKRRRCLKCGKFFWRISENDFCGEPECVGGYSFIRKPIGRKMDFLKSWSSFSTFFNNRGYTPIKRYPVAARWREDTDFVQASIYDFQPYVVSGEIAPPANPLVIPQYCARFNYIESVGITGRHNTGFVMIGQHAFFRERQFDKLKYFRDLFEWLTESVKLPKEELSIIENQWSGGGNLGVCLEFFARGLELANQVYMLYKVTNIGYERLGINVLDMGMGQDRVAWLTQGNLNIYEVDYPIICKKLYNYTGYHPDTNYEAFVPFGSLLDVSPTQKSKIWDEIANRMGINLKTLQETVLPLAAIYSLADHTQTLLVTISDGVLPSNISGGYNLRVILRRALSFIEKYGWNIDLIEVCRWHAEYLMPQYPELKNNLDEVGEILQHEKRKYSKLLKNTGRKIAKILRDEKQLTIEDMYRLYESEGITPEVIKEVFEEHGKRIEIPEDFYSKISLKSQKTITEINETSNSLLKGIEDTEILYYKDILNFNATVIKSWSKDNRFYCLLDKTAFYPRSGGQDYDLGKIGHIEVTGVTKHGKIIVHETNQPIIEGQEVYCRVNFDRRRNLAKLHTAAHIINGTARKLLGDHIWQAGSEITMEKGRLDITHYERLSKRKFSQLSRFANRIILENRKVEKKIMKRNEAEEKYGFRIYQGGAVPSKELRIVSIEGCDAEACGGMHVNWTSEVEEIMILRDSRLQDGVLRIEFVAGKELCKKAKEHLAKQQQEGMMRKQLKVNRLKKRKKLDEKLSAKIKRLDKIDEVEYFPSEDMSSLKILGRALLKKSEKDFLILFSDGLFFGIRKNSSMVKLDKIFEISSRILGGNYGNKGNEWSGGGPLKNKTADAVKAVRQYLQKKE